MGWMWSSSPPPPPSGDKGPDDDQKSKSKPQQQQQPPLESKNSRPSPEDEAAADPEISKFLAQVQSEFGSSNSRSKNSDNNHTSSSNKKSASESDDAALEKLWSSWSWESGTFSSSTTKDPNSSNTTTTTKTDHRQASGGTGNAVNDDDDSNQLLDPISESLLPTTMSCRDAWDRAFHCNSLGGQWTSVYREGNVRSCSEHWDDFWFCMRTRSYTSREMKAEAIREHFRRKERARYFGVDPSTGEKKPSSTDVWEARTEKLPPGNGAFGRPFQMPSIDDEEWRVMEIERRRQVLDGLRREEEERQRGRGGSRT